MGKVKLGALETGIENFMLEELWLVEFGTIVVCWPFGLIAFHVISQCSR